MFKRKLCGKCGKKVKDGFDFCPYCGNSMNDSKDGNWGMLGKNDSVSPFEEMRMPAGFNMLFNSLLRNIEKQFRNFDKQDARQRKRNVNISVSTRNGMPSINVASRDESKKRRQHELKRFFFDNFHSEKLRKFSKLPQEDPKTSVRRVENAVVYEIDLPGVKSAKDISILNLEKGMELRAVADKKAYLKSIPVNLPISDFKLSNGKFVLELDAEREPNHML